MYQKVIVIGNVGGDPEMRGNGNGKDFCSFSVAANERWKDANGEKQERTEWFNCTAFDKTAEIADKYLRKGHVVTVEGKLRTTKKDEKYYTNLIVDKLVLMPNARDEDKGSRGDDRRPAREERRPARDEERRPAREERRPARDDDRRPATREKARDNKSESGDFDDDIPF